MSPAEGSNWQEATGLVDISVGNVSMGSRCDRCGTSPLISATSSKWTASVYPTPFNSSSTISWSSPSTSRPIPNSSAKQHCKSSTSPSRPSPMSASWSSWITIQAHRCGAAPTMMAMAFGGVVNSQSINFSKAASSLPKGTRITRGWSAWTSETSWERPMEWRQPGGAIIPWLTGSVQLKYQVKRCWASLHTGSSLWEG